MFFSGHSVKWAERVSERPSDRRPDSQHSASKGKRFSMPDVFFVPYFGFCGHLRKKGLLRGKRPGLNALKYHETSV
jgi:hypothetical protein